MQTKVLTVALEGQGSHVCSIECCFARGFSGIQLLGTSSETAKNAKERVATALENSGVKLSNKKIIMNISPNSGSDEQPHFDLPLAVSLATLHLDKTHELLHKRPINIIGELCLDGSIKGVLGIIPILLEVARSGPCHLVLPRENLKEIEEIQAIETDLFDQIELFFFDHLQEIILWMRTGEYSAPVTSPLKPTISKRETKNFADMELSTDLKTIALLATVGRLNVLLTGSPGVGKSMFAERLPSLLPKLRAKEHIELLRLYSTQNKSIPEAIFRGHAPFRSPHHSASATAILGTPKKPGDLPLAHGGILFLDEIPEFRRDLLESLREPMETGVIKVSRAQSKTSWAAKAILVAASNPCPCGWLGSKKRLCHCPQQAIEKYQRKLSGPLLDRFHIRFRIADKKRSKNFLSHLWDESRHHSLAQTAHKAREFSIARNAKYHVTYNSELTGNHLLEACGLSPENTELSKLLDRCDSIRQVVKILQISRTLADIRSEDQVSKTTLKQAEDYSNSIDRS
ncbi:MAG: ATP-binding protein [Pseudobacteriovorax sp.]|nr:ATP-binding protein [Pseudobacteriovorax sp.]